MTTPLPRRFLLALPAVLVLPGAGCAQRGLPGGFSASGSALPDFADLAERILPAVVNIAVQGEPGQVPPELRGTPFERYFRERRGRQQMSGAGSGFIIDPSGFVVTNNHVVGTSSRVIVGLQDGTQLPARVVGTDELTDLALLKVEGRTAFPTVGFGSSAAMRVGAWVLAAAGNPFGLGGSVTSGIVSARGRDIGTGPFDDFLQTDAAINPGNSGGPLFNLAGEVIGINTAIYSPSGASAGIGFATPSDLARGVIEQLRRDGRVDRGWLGVAVQDQAPEPGQRGRRGVLVQGVERNSPAARAGLRQGDLVTALNGENLEPSRALIRTVAGTPPGQSVRLTYLREGRSQEVSVQVARRPAGAN